MQSATGKIDKIYVSNTGNAVALIIARLKLLIKCTMIKLWKLW